MEIPSYDEFFKQLKVTMWLLGTPCYNTKVYPRFYILMSFTITAVVLEILYVVKNMSLDNILEILSIVPCVAHGSQSVLKGVTIQQKRINIYELSDKLRLLYNDILSNTEKFQIVRNDLTLLLVLLKYFFIMNVFLISSYTLTSLGIMLYCYLTTNEIIFEQPFNTLLPFSTDTWMGWLTAYLFNSGCGLMAVLFYISIDGLYFVLTTHVSAHYCILGDMIKNLNEGYVEKLKDIVKAHQIILKLGGELENIFMFPNLVIIFMASLQICVIGFSAMVGPWDKMPIYVLFFVSNIVQLFMMSVFGENIKRDSTQISNAAYLCNWYDMDLKSQKTILIIITRAQKAQQLTAYKFSVIGYSSFSKIISTSWSYFTILNQVYIPENKLT